MTRLFRSISLLFLFLPLLLACEKENMKDCVKSTGPIVSEERPLPSFHVLDIEDHIHATIEQGSTEKVVVEGGKNLLPLVLTEVEDGKLKIRNENVCNWVRSFKKKLKVHVTVKELDKIIFNGSATLRSKDTLKGESLRFISRKASGSTELWIDQENTSFKISTGPSDLTLHGYCKNSYLYHSGNGFIQAKDLSANQTHVNHQGTGNFHVRAEERLKVRIGGVGNVYYKGSPQEIEKEVSGEGDLLKE